MNKQKRRSYTKDFKEEAVKLINEQRYSYAEAGRNLGVRYQITDTGKKVYTAFLLCKVMRVNRSGFYSW